MDTLKCKVHFLFIIIVLLLSQHLLIAGDDFNEMATKIYQKDIEGVKELLNNEDPKSFLRRTVYCSWN